jgi:MFS family permease
MAIVDSLRYRAFAFLWSGQTVSRFGDSLYRVALQWWVFEVARSPQAMGTLQALVFAPMVLFLLIGGVVVDRLPRLRVMLSADLLSSLVILSVAGLAFTQRLQLWHLFVASLLFGFVEAFFYPAFNAVVPDLIPEDARPSANSMARLSQDLTGVAGPAVGAWLVKLGGTAAAFLLNGLSFVVAAATVLPLVLTGREPPRTRPAPAGAWRDLGEGMAEVTANPWLWITIALFGAINITAASPASVALPFLVGDTLHADVGVLGLFQALFAAGSIAAALGLGRLKRIRRRGPLAYGATVLNGLCTLVFGLVPSIPILALASFVRGVSLTLFGLVWINTLQERVPREKLGRVYSIDALGSFALVPVGFGLVGWATAAYGAPAVFVVGGCTTAALALLGLLHPAVHRLD